MNKEEIIRLRWRAITGNLTEEDLNKLNALNIKTTSLENTQEIKLNDNNNYGMSNVIFLATISFVVEISFLLISMFLFK